MDIKNSHLDGQGTQGTYQSNQINKRSQRRTVLHLGEKEKMAISKGLY